jgi:hypothetical protein
MSRIALYFASGESLYLGAVLLLLVLVAPTLLKHRWTLRIRNVVACVALVLMVMACPPFALVVDLIFAAVFLLWLITSNQVSPSRTFIKLQRGSTLVLVILLLALPAIEFSHRGMPTVTGTASDHLVVIGDSISSGIDQVEPWPIVLQQQVCSNFCAVFPCDSQQTRDREPNSRASPDLTCLPFPMWWCLRGRQFFLRTSSKEPWSLSLPPRE